MSPRLWGGFCLLLMLLVLLSALGCAEARYLTKEQDAEMREKCTEGCVVVPAPLMQEVIRRLQGNAI